MAAAAVIAHRGASAHAPENTLAAFALAAELGASSIETDLRSTREDRLVLFHDARVNRTTDGRGRLSQLPLDRVRRLDAGSWFGRAFAGERIPTLEEGLALTEELGLEIYLEMKIPLDPALLFALARQLRPFRLDRVVLLSFRPAVLRAIQAIEPRLRTALLLRRARVSLPAARESGIRILAPHRRRITRRLAHQAHRAGLVVVTWTVNGPREMRKMLDLGVDGIMTDWPERMIEVLREREPERRLLVPRVLTPVGKDR